VTHTPSRFLTPFVGRATELVEILQRISQDECRLLTLIGPGGIGKTRLAAQAMAERQQAGCAVSAGLGSATGLMWSPVIGRLSDRVNRVYLLCLIYAIGVLALIMLARNSTLVGFIIVSALMAVNGAERAVSSALIIDLLPSHALNRGISFLDAAKWIGGVIGFAGTGYAIQFMGLY